MRNFNSRIFRFAFAEIVCQSLFDFLDLLWLNNWPVLVGKCRKSVGKKLGLSILLDRKIVLVCVVLC